MPKHFSNVPGLEQGRCVGLTKEAATTFTCMDRSYGHKNGPIDWHKRRGTVVRVSVETDTVYVKWDDRTSLDSWPIKAIVAYSRPPPPPQTPSSTRPKLCLQKTKSHSTA